MARQPILLLLRLLSHSQSKPIKPLNMELLWLLLVNVFAALRVFLAMTCVVVSLPVSKTRKLVEASWKDDFDLASLEPYPLRPIEGRARYKMNMGLRRMDSKNWLTIDKNYAKEHQVRSELLEREKDRVIRCLSGSEAACAEALEVVVEHLTQRYREVFRTGTRNGKRTVSITATGEVFQITEPYGGMCPLEIAARLSMEDLSVLISDGKDAEYFLAASATMFPVGWNVSQRVGWPMSKIHGPVPTWKANVGAAVNNFFSRIREDNALERSPYFIQVAPREDSLLSKMFRPEVLSEQATPRVRDILIRRERQTFRKLPKSGAVLFAVKTAITPLQDLEQDERLNLAREIRSWPEGIAAYKSREFWGPCVLDFIECGIES